MRRKLHFAVDGQPLSDAKYVDVLPIYKQMQGRPALYKRANERGKIWARALAGVDALGELRWVVRIVQIDTETTEHVCDDRCRLAKSRICACSCGGVNHGAGLIQCKAA
jgi:hypothetical protein